MISKKFMAVGLASLAFFHPSLKQLGDFDQEQAALEVDTADIDEEMGENLFRNGVVFGLWVAGVAISVGRLLTYLIGGRGRKGEDVHTQTDVQEKIDESTETKQEQLEKKLNIINQTSYTKLPASSTADDTPHEVPKQASPPGPDEGVPDPVPDPVPDTDDNKQDCSDVAFQDCDEKQDSQEKGEKKISVYKLPAIKRHYFLISLDGMRVLRQTVHGDFSLEKVTLEGIRNFIFLVAKGSPSQLADLETKIRTTFPCLTPVRAPSSKLTGGVAIQQPQRTTIHESSRIPTKLTRATGLPLHKGLVQKTLNPKANH